MDKWIKKRYERISGDGSGKMKISRDKIQKYLCMTLIFSAPVEFNITIVSYIEEMTKDFNKHDQNINKSSTSASDYLSNTGDNAIFLYETLANIYHKNI